MLSLIRVKNYAVIDEIEVEFGGGFNVMTGETGAGKSILVDALGLALGDRADATAVRQDAERAEISVSFDVPTGHAALAWLAERGLDDETACTLRRLLATDGRSRAFINGQPVNLQDLRALGSLLVDIHGQHAHQSLLDTGNQRALLDAHDEIAPLATTVAETFRDVASVARAARKPALVERPAPRRNRAAAFPSGRARDARARRRRAGAAARRTRPAREHRPADERRQRRARRAGGQRSRLGVLGCDPRSTRAREARRRRRRRCERRLRRSRASRSSCTRPRRRCNTIASASRRILHA